MVDNKVMALDDAVKVTGQYKPQQVMAIGHAPSTAKRALYQYFTNRYLGRMVANLTATNDDTIINRLASTMEHFARTAESIAHFRLAQTWRLLAYTMNLLLTRRAEYHRKSRLTPNKAVAADAISKQSPENSPKQRNNGEETPRKPVRGSPPYPSPLHRGAKPSMTEDIESTSNVATPLVHPVRDNIAHETREAMHTPLVEDDILQLPEAAHTAAPSPIPVPSSSLPSNKTASSVEGYDFYGLESFSPAIDFVAPPKKQPLRLDYSDHSDTTRRMQPQRHDSGESFQMFSTSGDSQSARFMGSSGSNGQSKSHGSSLRDQVSSWKDSLPSHQKHRSSIDSDAKGQSESSDEHFTPDSPQPYRSTRNGVLENPAYPPVFHIQEASVPEPINNRAAIAPLPEVSSSPSENTSDNPNIIENDYLPWQNDPKFIITPIDPTVLVQRSITFEAHTGALNASAMILLLRSLLPFGSIDEIQAGAILAQYHQRLTSMKLFTEAAMLRNLCVPLYPNVFAMGQENVTMGFFCTGCHKPLENDPLIPNSQWRCPRCQQAINGCAICLQQDAVDYEYDVDDTVENALWWYCPGCGHGGHTACMAAWHAGPEYEEGTKYSGGCCPLEGCLHPCLPGTWRNVRTEEKKAAKQRELDLLVKENSRQGSRGRGVRRDVREVNQSKAVEGVRVTLGIGGLERKKSVKVVAPGEESRG
jgi:hypothetical protein